MRRFLLSLFFVGALSAVFSFTAFANWTEPVSSAYMGSGQATYNHTVTYNVSASPGDVWYFDVSFTWYGETIYNPSNQNITAQVYNRTFDKSASLVALGSNYGAADVSIEGNRVWLVFNQSVSSVTVTLQIEYSLSWQSGTFNGSPTQDLSNCIATMTCNANCGTIYRSRSGLPSLSSNSDKLDTIMNQLASLGGTSYLTDYLGPDAVLYFDQRYFRNESSCGLSGGLFSSPGGLTRFNPYNNNYQVSYTVQPGNYYLILGVPRSSSDNNFGGITNFSFYPNSSIPITRYSTTADNNFWYVIYTFTLDDIVSLRQVVIDFLNPVPSGLITGGIVAYSVDDQMSSAVNPDQDGTVSDVDDAGHQQSQQEEEMWQNINTYKGDLSFNLDGWDDAAGGLSYVTSVFMTIWNNSPTQPIVLSLMLGIAMLSIGRGVMAAVRVSRNRGDD